MMTRRLQVAAAASPLQETTPQESQESQENQQPAAPAFSLSAWEHISILSLLFHANTEYSYVYSDADWLSYTL